jgi:hypothetical protein
MEYSLPKKKRPIRVGISLLTGLALSGVSLLAGGVEVTKPGVSLAEVTTPKAWTSVPHVFSTGDVQRGFDGVTATEDPNMLCVATAPLVCAGDLEGPPDNRGWFAVDSEFGFYVTDFVGAEQKAVDFQYTEGYVSDTVYNGAAGIAVSNAKTDRFKVPYPRGTWCAGLGGVSNKCSTENYAVLEHVLTCFETLPYRYAGSNAIPVAPGDLPSSDPWSNLVELAPVLAPGITCTDAQLDNVLYFVDGLGVGTTLLTPDAEGFPDMPANESTILHDVAVGLKKDYAITRKDDGKALFRFGNLIKRPNDIRMFAQMALPQEWKDTPATNFTVTRAELIINHLITNNPNDQIRPEDMENEDAIGLKPRKIDTLGLWTSTVDCYEGDGDFIPAGTVMKQPSTFTVDGAPFDLESLYVTSATAAAPFPYPYAYSGDLREGYTNAWATSTDRDPFEWSDSTRAGESAHAANPLGTVTTVIGPRWRLLPNKFGQDIPGMEIPGCGANAPLDCNDDEPMCIPVPFTSAFIKYDVGEKVSTVINLLDWEDTNDNGLQDDSPLAKSAGWMDASENWQNWTKDPAFPDVSGANCLDGFCTDTPNAISVNGAPLSEDFDVVIYVKGDRKATELYDMSLYLEYEGFGVVTPVLDAYPQNLLITPVRGATTSVRDTAKVAVEVVNDGASVSDASGTVNVVGMSGSVEVFNKTWSFSGLAPGVTNTYQSRWVATHAGIMNWTATVTADGDTNPGNDTITATYSVLPLP